MSNLFDVTPEFIVETLVSLLQDGRVSWAKTFNMRVSIGAFLSHSTRSVVLARSLCTSHRNSGMDPRGCSTRIVSASHCASSASDPHFSFIALHRSVRNQFCHWCPLLFAPMVCAWRPYLSNSVVWDKIRFIFSSQLSLMIQIFTQDCTCTVIQEQINQVTWPIDVPHSRKNTAGAPLGSDAKKGSSWARFRATGGPTQGSAARAHTLKKSEQFRNCESGCAYHGSTDAVTNLLMKVQHVTVSENSDHNSCVSLTKVWTWNFRLSRQT